MHNRSRISTIDRVRIPVALAMLATALVLSGAGQQAAAGQALPAFDKEFSPDTIGPGSTTTLTFTIDNVGGPAVPLDELAFTDTLPTEIEVADAPAITNSCGGTVTATPGSGSIVLSGGDVGANEVCEISVNVTSDVTTSEVGHENVTGALTSSEATHGTANDELFVDDGLPGFSKSFAPSIIEFGERSTLTFTIDNSSNGSDVETLDFTDTLPPGLLIADPSLAATDCGIALLPPTLIAVPGTSVISLDADGTFSFPALGGEGTCTVEVDVVGDAVGVLENVSGDLIVDLGTSTSAGIAADTIEVTEIEATLELLKRFGGAAAPGGSTTLEFTVTNRSRDHAATDIAFSDDLDATLSGLEATGAVSNDCGGMASSAFPTGLFEYEGGSLAPEGTCTVVIDVAVPSDAPAGSYPNSAGPVTGDIDGSPVTGNTAGDLLFVIPFPILDKDFTVDTIGTGDTVTLEFTITNPEDDSTMSDITFIDELTDGSGGVPPDTTSGFFPFPVTVTIPPGDPCGAGSSLSSVSIDTDRQGLELTGGTLEAAGHGGGLDTCTFSVDVDIPSDMAAGTYTNHTEDISATLDDLPGSPTASGPGSSDDLTIIAAPQLTKEFTDDPVAPGDPVTLVFTLFNADDTNAASAIAFDDDLTTVVAGLEAASVDTNTCGATVDISTSTTIAVSGGTLAALGTCEITLTLDVPPAIGGIFNNETSTVTATVAGLAAEGAPAADDLVVAGLLLTKVFDPDTVIPGQETDITFTLDNTGPADATAIAFSDDLSAILPGTPDITVVTTLPFAACGGTVSGTPTSLSFSGGAVASADPPCSFDVTVLVPVGAADGEYSNLTSGLTYSAPTPFSGPPARDDVSVDSTLLEITKEFTDDPVAPGDTVTLMLTLENLSATETVTDIEFDDDLDAALSGLEAVAATSNTCGGMATSAFPTGLFEYAGGTLTPGATCEIVLDLDVPDPPLPSGPPYINTTTAIAGKVGALDVGGDPASDELVINTIALSKSFDGPTTATGTAVLTFTIENLDPANPVGGMAFSDDLDDALTGLEMTGAVSPTPPCGPGSDLTGTSFLALTDASLPAAGSCSFDATVSVPDSATAGTYVNLTSELFVGGLPGAVPASAELTIEPPPTFAKVFAPDAIVIGGVSTLTFTIDNTASAVGASALDFSDSLPTGIEVAATPAATTDCTGGVITATAGTDSIAYTGGTVGAGVACTVDVDVTATASGVLVNTTGALTSSSGDSGTASDTLTVGGPPFTTVTGKRYADTRIGGSTFDGLFEGAGPRAAGSTYEVQITGRDGVPASAIGAIMNVTSVGSSAPAGFFTVFPCGALPTASAVNYVPGVDVANEVFAKLSPTGSVCVYTFSQSNLLIDVVGFVLPEHTTTLLDPARLAESREGAPTVDGLMAGFGRTTAGSTTTVQVTGRGGVPATDVLAAIVNVAAVDPTADSFLTVFPCGPVPTASSLNYAPSGVNRANELIASLSVDGELCVFTDTDIDLVVDVVGFVEVGSDLVTSAPTRFADTRGGPTIDGLNMGGGPVTPGSTYEVQIAGRDGVPADAIEAIVNVAAVDPLANGFFTVTGCVTPTPNASSLNYTTGVNGANELVVDLSDSGKICIFTSAGTDLIVDVAGHVKPPPSTP